MSLFTSRREKRLWLWALAVIAAIFASLGIAPGFAGVLRENGLLAAAFVLGMVLVGATIVTHGLQERPGKVELAIILGLSAVFYMLFLRIGTLEERSHLIEFGVLAVLIFEALTERARNGRHVPLPALIAILATATLGVIDEGIQVFLPGRVFDPIDILFNGLAGFFAVGASLALVWVRRGFS